MDYTPSAWYWQATDGRIYSSAKQAIKTEKDKDFIAWLQLGNWPTPWPKDATGKETDAALAEVLAPHGLRLFPPTLDEVKQELRMAVDLAAEHERQKYITGGSGQSMTYTEKFNQAAIYAKAYAAHLNDPENVKAPNENEYLLLKSSLGIDGNTLAEVAENITWAYALWEQVGAAIETIRLQTKAAINKAENVKAAQAVFDGIKWP